MTATIIIENETDIRYPWIERPFLPARHFLWPKRHISVGFVRRRWYYPRLRFCRTAKPLWPLERISATILTCPDSRARTNEESNGSVKIMERTKGYLFKKELARKQT